MSDQRKAEQLFKDVLELQRVEWTLNDRQQRIRWEKTVHEILKTSPLTIGEKKLTSLFLEEPRSNISVSEAKKLVRARLNRVFSPLTFMFGRAFAGPKATPRNCELVLSLLLSKEEQDPAIGDFLERYEQKRKRLGRRRADLWAYSDVLRTVWPVLRRKLGTLLKFALAAEWVRRQFHQ